MKDEHCTSVLRRTQEHIRQLGQLGRTGQSLSPVVNIVTKVQMSVGDEAVDCFASGSATTVACDLYDKNMLLVGLQYVGMYFYRVLPRYIAKECIDV